MLADRDVRVACEELCDEFDLARQLIAAGARRVDPGKGGEALE
jgi:hypothetical protein